MPRNIELKARLPDLSEVRLSAEALGATLFGPERQCDTYFRVFTGRLKLRQRWQQADALDSELIFYSRPNESDPKASDYLLTKVADGATLRASLSVALGVLVQVDKTRTVYVYDNVRIHLDDVANLGTFLEFEAIVDAGCDDDQARRKIDRLAQHFKLKPEWLLSGSYSDLLLHR